MKYSKKKYKPDYQIGLEWKNDRGEQCITFADYPRKIIFEVKSWKGIGALFAIHYYSSLRVPSPSWRIGGKGNFSGYGGKNRPEIESIDIDCLRTVTRVERDARDEIIAKIGETTHRMNTEIEAIFAGLEALRECFEGDWMVSYRDYEFYGPVLFPLSELEVSVDFARNLKTRAQNESE